MAVEASIDIGTNTILLLIAQLGQQAGDRFIEHVIYDEQTIVRLGQGVSKTKAFAPEAMTRAFDCLKLCRARCDQAGVKLIRAVATSASRDARNSGEFYDRVRRELDIDVKIIAGESEAKYGFLGGLMPGQDPLQAVLIDIGGGSTEFVTAVSAQSVDMGSVRATETYLAGNPYTRGSVEALNQGLQKFWPTLNPALQAEIRVKDWTGVAGTVTTLAALAQNLSHFDAASIDSYRLQRATVGHLFDSLAAQPQEARAAIAVVGAGRADVITAGAAVLLSAMSFFGKTDLIVSTRGLRYGVLLESSLETLRKPVQ